jgi:hypothetical protein
MTRIHNLRMSDELWDRVEKARTGLSRNRWLVEVVERALDVDTRASRTVGGRPKGARRDAIESGARAPGRPGSASSRGASARSAPAEPSTAERLEAERIRREMFAQAYRPPKKK